VLISSKLMRLFVLFQYLVAGARAFVFRFVFLKLLWCLFVLRYTCCVVFVE
jgi:hypothetical protein